ncbi:MAG: signal recognition particle-docking protein FtsY [Oscillospiraceae bacterium]|nr:signal recognition particle-docking protein FtsY [Oscillospiraceae bacterium]
MGFFSKIKKGLSRTREGIKNHISNILKNFSSVDKEFLEELEELLILSDVGAKTARDVCKNVEEISKKEKIKNQNEIRSALKKILLEILGEDKVARLNTKPSVILTVGVNGVGKTTSVGKLAHNIKLQGKSVIIAAADTFRAAAIEQLQVWAERADAEIVKQQQGSDPAAVVFDTISAAKKRDKDVIICDTAGRLHNKKDLMRELEKISRIINRELPEADKEILLVLDATIGQNAVNQAREFANVANITGIILTKLDGTAKGGIVFAIKRELNIPVEYIGLGEQIDDLQAFSAKQFVDAIFLEE